MKKLRRKQVLLHALPLVLVANLLNHAAWAAESKWEVKSGDSIGSILAKQYPNYTNRAALAQAVLAANPTAFIKGDINRLVVGKVLTLPDAATIPNATLATPALPTVDNSVQKVGGADQQRVQALESQLNDLQGDLKSMSAQNADLKASVERYETDKQSKTAELDKLEGRLKELEELKVAPAGAGSKPAAASNAGVSESEAVAKLDVLTQELNTVRQDLVTQRKANEDLQQQVTTAQQQTTALTAKVNDLSQQNASLANDLTQAKAATVAAEQKASHAGWLPWILFGLVTLLLAPLLWLLKRKYEEPVVATMPAPSANKAQATDLLAPRSTVAAPPKSIPEPTAPPAASLATSTVTTQEVTPASALPVGTVSTPEEEEAVLPPEDPEVDLKLDIARAYLDIRDSEAAAEMLQEVLTEGGSRQRQDAREILSFIT